MQTFRENTYSLDFSTYLRDSDMVLSILLKNSFMLRRLSSSGVMAAATESKDLLCLAVLPLLDILKPVSPSPAWTNNSPAMEYGRVGKAAGRGLLSEDIEEDEAEFEDNVDEEVQFNGSPPLKTTPPSCSITFSNVVIRSLC